MRAVKEDTTEVTVCVSATLHFQDENFAVLFEELGGCFCSTGAGVRSRPGSSGAGVILRRDIARCFAAYREVRLHARGIR